MEAEAFTIFNVDGLDCCLSSTDDAVLGAVFVDVKLLTVNQQGPRSHFGHPQLLAIVASYPIQ